MHQLNQSRLIGLDDIFPLPVNILRSNPAMRLHRFKGFEATIKSQPRLMDRPLFENIFTRTAIVKHLYRYGR